MRPMFLCISVLLLLGSSFAAPKTHTVVLGKWRAVEVRSDSGEAQEIKVRELIIDGRTREYTTGATHEVTDRLFVVRRAHRINDALPEETVSPSNGYGGWTDGSALIARPAMWPSSICPAFDGDTSEASWYRDYAAYCGASDDGSKALYGGFTIGQAQAYP